VDQLEEIRSTLIKLCTDMEYVKQYMKDNSKLITEIAVLKLTVSGLNKIAWKIGSAVGIAIVLAVLGLII